MTPKDERAVGNAVYASQSLGYDCARPSKVGVLDASRAQYDCFVGICGSVGAAPCWIIRGCAAGWLSGRFLPSPRFVQRGAGWVTGRVGAPVLFHAQPDQNRKHDKADDSFFLSRENEHQLRRGFT